MTAAEALDAILARYGCAELVATVRAELERLREKHMKAEERLDCVSLMLAGADKQIETLAASVAFHERNALRAEADLAAARADAERYRYLRHADRRLCLTVSGPVAGCWIDCDGDNGELVLLTGEDADKAIDAALAGKDAP